MRMDEKFLQILKKALQVYVKFGIKSVSMDDLCKELRISKKTLYKYVANKEDLLEHIFVDYVSPDIEEFFNEKFNENKGNAIDYFFSAISFLKQYDNITPLIFNDLRLHYPTVFAKLTKNQRERKVLVLERNLQQGQSEGLYRTDINTQIVIFIFSSIQLKDSEIETGFSKEDSFVEFFRIFMASITTPKGMKYYNALRSEWEKTKTLFYHTL